MSGRSRKFVRGVVVVAGLAGLGVGLGCQDDGRERTRPSDRVETPDVAVTQPSSETATDGASDQVVVQHVNACFLEFERTLAELPVDQRINRIAGISSEMRACSTAALEDDGYEIDAELSTAVNKAMQERTAEFTRKLIEMATGG